MDHWNECAYPGILDMAKQDEIYLELLDENKVLEAEYMKLRENLTGADQEMLDRYIASCENMEFRFAQLSYWYGLFQKN